MFIVDIFMITVRYRWSLQNTSIVQSVHTAQRILRYLYYYHTISVVLRDLNDSIPDRFTTDKSIR